MPNLSHGLAGVATALALAGAELRPPGPGRRRRRAARSTWSRSGDVDEHGFVVPRYLPRDFNDQDEVTYTWCHGGAGTSLLFVALEHAGVGAVAGEPPGSPGTAAACTASAPRACPRASTRASGTTTAAAAGRPGWATSSWTRGGGGGDERDLEFARHLADTLVDRALLDGPHAYWRFVEHHAEDPLLPPGVGWMQGAAGIAAYLFRVARVVRGRPGRAGRLADGHLVGGRRDRLTVGSGRARRVAQVHHPGRQRGGVQQLERVRRRRLEQPLPGAPGDRVHEQRELVDQTLAEQPAHGRRRAGRCDVAVDGRLELPHPVGRPSPGITVVLLHDASVSVPDTTYFGIVLMCVANGSSVAPGQYDDHSSYSVRPRRNALWVASPAAITSPMASSKASPCHSYGASTTPSRVMKKFETIRPMVCSR